MSHPYHWASDLLSRRVTPRQAKSNRNQPAAGRRRRRLFESLEQRIVFANVMVDSLAALRGISTTSNNDTITLNPTKGDPHPVTGLTTAGEYWINGDHFKDPLVEPLGSDPLNSEPTFLELGGSNNTFELGGTSINLDTRDLDGFGRALGHDSGIEVVKISGSGNTVNGLNLTGYDLAMDTDPGAQRYADWAAVYVQLTGTDNTVQGANVLSRGSSPYGLGDAFGKGGRSFPQGEPPGQVPGEPDGVVGLPWVGHNKTSTFQVLEATRAVVDNMHLQAKTYGHGFFVQKSSDTTLTNSTVTGELVPASNVINHPKYQEYGFTSHGNEIPEDIMISANEDGVRLYGSINGVPTVGFTVDNVVVTNMRSGFATALGFTDLDNGLGINLSNVEAYGTETAFGIGSLTNVTNAKADITNGPAIHFPYNNVRDTTIDLELVGDVPVGLDYAVAYLNGQRLDVTIDSDLDLGDLPADSMVRFGQTFFNNWRDTLHPTGPEDGDPGDFIDSTFTNTTNQLVVLGNLATNNTGSSQGGVISNGKNNDYDGVTFVFSGNRLTVEHVDGLGNNGAVDANAGTDTFDSNGTIVSDGATLQINPGLRVTNERVVITGGGVVDVPGVDGKGAVYSEGSADNNTRLVGAGNDSIVILDGDASIGVGTAGNQLLVGRVSGTGDLTKLGPGILSMERSSTFDGDLIVAEGHVTTRSNVVRHGLTVAGGASISAIGNNGFNTQDDVDLDGTLDLNSRDGNFISNLSGTIGRLNGSGQITSSNTDNAASGGTLTFDGDGDDGLFTGTINGGVELVKSGTNTQVLAGSLTHTRTTTVNDGGLNINGSHTGGDDYTVNSGGTLGGNGSIGSAVLVGAAGHLSPGASAGSLSVNSVTLSSGAFFDVEVGGTNAGSEYDQLMTNSAMLGGVLSISLLDSVGATYQPLSADTFTVLASSTSLSGMFENVASGQRLVTVGGEGTFLVTYGGPGDSVLLSDFEATELDFGDAPASYSTLLTNNGARHATVGPQLGSSRDIDSEGVPTVAADGDGNDEDGALFGGIGVLSTVAAVNIELAGASEAKVDAWIDFNRDGVWDASEKIVDDILVNQSMQTLNYDVPAGLTTGDTYARVRLSSAGGLSPTGYADDGEVEDYVVSIIEPPAVESIVINQGEEQRSSLHSVQVTFDQLVDVDNSGDDAIKFIHTASGDAVKVISTIVPSSEKTIIDFTFDPTGPHVLSFGSLENGDYQLIIDASRVTSLGVGLDGNNDGSGGNNYQMSAVDGFFRKYGDADGNGSVGLSDFAEFRATFGLTDSDDGYHRGLDADGNGQIGLSDFAAFRNGFGT